MYNYLKCVYHLKIMILLGEKRDIVVTYIQYKEY